MPTVREVLRKPDDRHVPLMVHAFKPGPCGIVPDTHSGSRTDTTRYPQPRTDAELARRLQHALNAPAPRPGRQAEDPEEGIGGDVRPWPTHDFLAYLRRADEVMSGGVHMMDTLLSLEASDAAFVDSLQGRHSFNEDGAVNATREEIMKQYFKTVIDGSVMGWLRRLQPRKIKFALADVQDVGAYYPPQSGNYFRSFLPDNVTLVVLPDGRKFVFPWEGKLSPLTTVTVKRESFTSLLGPLADQEWPPSHEQLRALDPLEEKGLVHLVGNLAAWANSAFHSGKSSCVVQERAYLAVYGSKGIIYTGNDITFCSLEGDGTMLCSDRFWTMVPYQVTEEMPYSLLETLVRFHLAPFAGVGEGNQLVGRPTANPKWWDDYIQGSRKDGGDPGPPSSSSSTGTSSSSFGGSGSGGGGGAPPGGVAAFSTATLRPLVFADLLDPRRFLRPPVFTYEESCRQLEGDAVRVGSGRVGEVWRARIEGWDVAIKLLSCTNKWRDESEPRFEELELEMEREVEAYVALSALQGDKIPRLLWHGPMLHGLYKAVATEYSGVALEKLMLERKTMLSVAQADACVAALDAVHAAGVFHGDVHARNIVVDDVGKVRILDFTNARFRAECNGEEWTKATQEEKRVMRTLLETAAVGEWPKRSRPF